MLCIVPATGERFLPALELLFSELSANARAQRIAEFQREIQDSDFDPQHLLLAEIDAQPVGVQLTILRDDDVGMVWPPVVDQTRLQQTNGPASEVVEDTLLSTAARQLKASGAWIGQALLEPHRLREQAAMQRNGFPKLTDLRFFERTLGDDSFLEKSRVRSGLSYEPYRRSRNRLAFVNVLDGTYRGTLDCPELNGVRDSQQSLKHHELAGSFVPDMWRLYRRAGVDVGILLMVERPEQLAWEVLYLGVVESARGNGIGKAMLLDAFFAAQEANAKRLLIVADVRNVPAISLYESLGCQSVAMRSAFVMLTRQLPHNRPHETTRQQ